MNRLTLFFHRVEKLLSDNSPLILTAVGVAGTVTTSVLAGQASFRAAEILRTENERLKKQADYHREIYRKQPGDYPMTFRYKVGLVWDQYVETVIAGALTVAAIIGSNRISNRRAAALATAYSLTERAYARYMETTQRHVGDRNADLIRNEAVQSHADHTPGSKEIVIVADEAICFDSYSGRYFKSTMEALKKAQNDTVYQVHREGYASLTDFYQRIGLPPTAASEEIGWTADQKPLEIAYSTILTEDGRPAISIDFLVSPVREYWKFG